MCFQRNFFQGRKEFTITWDELWESLPGSSHLGQYFSPFEGSAIGQQHSPPFKGDRNPQLGRF